MANLPQNGGSFYTSAASVLIDPFVSPPTMQSQMASELARCEDLVRRDLRYAHLVAGASKMPMSMIWVARNQGGDVNDSDLASLRDVAWNEFVKKRFLPSVAEGTPVADAAASMLEIVRSMNLQRRRFQIMGLHEQVEASELQFVLHLCQAGLLHTSEYRVMANRFRRHDQFFEAFALAVGAFVCASAPFTLGVATTQLNRSLQYDYKKHTIALFVFVLQQNRALIAQCGTGHDEDYVARIARLIIVSHETGVAGHRQEDECCDKRGGRVSEEFLRSTIDSVQRLADRVERTAERVDRDLGMIREAYRENRGGRDGAGRGEQTHGLERMRQQLETRVQESVQQEIGRINEGNTKLVEILRQENTEFSRRAKVQLDGILEMIKKMESAQTKHMTGNLEANQAYAIRLQEDFDRRGRQLSDEARENKQEIQEITTKLSEKIASSTETSRRQFEELSARLTRDFQSFISTHTSIFQPQSAVSSSAQPANQSPLNIDERIHAIAGAMWNQKVETLRSELKSEIGHDFHAMIDSRISGYGINTIEPRVKDLADRIGNVISGIQTEVLRTAHGCSMLQTQVQGFQPFISHVQETLGKITGYAKYGDLEELYTKQSDIEQKFLTLNFNVEKMNTTVSSIVDELDRLNTSGESGPRLQRSSDTPTLNAVGAGVSSDQVQTIAGTLLSQQLHSDENIQSLASAIRRNRDFESSIDLIVNARLITHMATIESRLRNLESSRPSPVVSTTFSAFETMPDASARYEAATTRPAGGDGSQGPPP